MSSPDENDLAISELVASDLDLFSDGFVPADNFHEARQFPRFPFRGRARALVFALAADEEPIECEVLTTDLSRSGLSLLNRQPLQPGQQILLMLNDSTRLVEVCWCCRVWAGLYSAGCRFVGVPAEGTSDS